MRIASPQVVVGVPHQAAVGAIDLVALIPRRVQAGSPGNGSGLGIVLDRSHLAREFRRRDDVDSGNTQQQHVGRLTQGSRQLALDRSDRSRAWPADRHRARRRTGDGVMPAPSAGGADRAQATIFCRVGLWVAIWAFRSCRVRPSMPASTISAAEPRFLATQSSNVGIEDVRKTSCDILACKSGDARASAAGARHSFGRGRGGAVPGAGGWT